jgi:hypothetical protein
MRPGALRHLGSATRRSRFKRTVGASVQHGVRKRCRSCAIFRPPTISVATRTLTSGASRNGRRARDTGRSCTWLPKLEPTLCRLDGRPCAELACRGSESGGRRSHRPMKAGGGGRARRGGGGTQMPWCRFFFGGSSFNDGTTLVPVQALGPPKKIKIKT